MSGKKILTFLTLSLFLLCSCKEQEKIEVPKTYTLPYPFEGAVVKNDDSEPWFIGYIRSTSGSTQGIVLYQEFIELFSPIFDVYNYQETTKDEINDDFTDYLSLRFLYKNGSSENSLINITDLNFVYTYSEDTYYYIPKDIIDGKDIRDYMDNNGYWYEDIYLTDFFDDIGNTPYYEEDENN